MNVIANSTFNGISTDKFDLISFLAAKRNSPSLLNTKKTYRKKEYVYYSNEQAQDIYLIVKGSVKIEKNVGSHNVIVKNIFSKRDIFGETALIENASRIDYAIALEETEVYVIHSLEFKRCMHNYQKLSEYIINLISKRLIEAELKIESYAFNNSRTRIITFLIDLAKKNGQRIGYELLVRKFYTHQEIANCTATSRQTVTTVLNELKRGKLITFNRKRLLIRNIAQLKSEINI